MGFSTLYRHNKNIRKTAAAQRAKSETKLAIAGSILSVVTFLCAIFCASMVLVTMTHEVMMGKLNTVRTLITCLVPFKIRLKPGS